MLEKWNKKLQADIDSLEKENMTLKNRNIVLSVYKETSDHQKAKIQDQDKQIRFLLSTEKALNQEINILKT